MPPLPPERTPPPSPCHPAVKGVVVAVLEATGGLQGSDRKRMQGAGTHS